MDLTRLDRFGRHHPRCTFAAVLLLGVVAALLVLSQQQVVTVLYQGF